MKFLTQKNGFRPILALLLAMLLLLSLSGCDSGTDGGETSGDGDVGVESSADGTEESGGESVGAEQIFSVLTADLPLYRIIYPQDASEEVLSQVSALYTAISDAFGADLEMRDDFVKAGTVLAESEYEILIGRCDRTQTADFCKGLRSNDYGYTVLDKKIIVTGCTESGTVSAVNAFIADVIRAVNPSAELLLSSADGVTVRGEYDVNAVYLNGTEIGQYTIVYPSGSADLKRAASYLASCLSEFYGYSLKVIADSKESTGREILLGNTARAELSDAASLGEHEYLMAEVGGSVALTGTTVTMVYRAIGGLLDGFAEDAETESLSLTVSDSVKVTCSTSTIRTMTFNIRCAEFTSQRIELVFRMINLYAPDTIGFQEATVDWMTVLKNRLGDSYGCVGVGRNANGSGEASPVFYLKSKFELIESGTKWMTSTPDVAGSKIAESSLPRVFSYAVLRVIETGQTFVHVNTHLEHTSETAREIQAGYLTEFLEQYRTAGMAYVVSGDFNCARGTGSYSKMIAAGLADALNEADEAIPGTTYHGYGTTDKVIDHIFVSPAVDVLYYKACTETFKYSDGSVAYPSDHNPVVVDCVIQ